ncbi:MAG: hypothetical protein MJ096_01460 [Clostridia bacterium]|nr:hypothetical protein [Clostridia bacterium]
MSKKIMALLLVLVMVIPMIVSCGSDDKGTDETNAGTQSATKPVETNEFTEMENYVAELSANNKFGGATFNIIGSGGSIYPEVEEVTGVLEDDALYNRVRSLEENFEIDITFRESLGTDGYDNTGAETADMVRQDVMANSEGSYDLAEGHLTTCGQVMLGGRLILPVDDLDYVDLSREWWLNDLEEVYGIGGRTYFLTGKINPDHYTNASCMLFNKEVATNYGIDNLYELVDADEWTFDKMVETASVITAGGEVRRYLIGATTSLYFGAGFKLSERDENGDPYLPSALSSDAVDYIDKMAAVFSDDSTVFNVKNNTATPSKEGEFYDRQEFEDGHFLYWFDNVGRAIDLRQNDYEAEFGILPIPKKDTAQKDYISYTEGRAVYIPTNVKNKAMTDVVTEAMAALSIEYLEPAYYEKALKGKVEK